MDSNEKTKKQNVFREEQGVVEENEEKKTIDMDRNIAGFLCYLIWFITGIIFLVIEKENRFIRFHALQSIVVSIVLFVFNFMLTLIPILGLLISLLLVPLYIFLWIFL